jgi:putative oligomerization/nucleic acid binding protein
VGLFNRIKDPVTGTGRVVWARPGSGSRTEVQLAVQALGVESFEAMYTVEAPRDRPLVAGASVPITFDRERHQRLRIEWDQVPAAAAPAPPAREPVAEPSETAFPAGSLSFSSQVVDARDRPDLLAPFEAMTGMDLDGDGRVPGQTTGDDTIDRLERLARLREQGLLNDAEFAAEKKKILGPEL